MRPLVIFWGYKEIQNASAQIARTFWEHVPNDVFNPTIVCAKIDSPFESSLPMLQIKECRLLHVFFSVLRKIGLRDLTLIPDVEYYSWNPFALRKIKKLIKRENFDYIHTISSPQSTHLLGLKLKQISGMPWVMQCNDPWHDTSGRKYRFDTFFNLDLKYEKKAAKGADIIIHSNNVIKDIWSERYGDIILSKIKVLPFSFNIWNLPCVKEQTTRNGVLTISHIGNVYSTRSSMTIFQGIELMLSEHPETKEMFKIQFVGGIHEEEKEYALKHNLSKYVDFVGHIAPENLYSYYESSDVFLIIDVIIKRNPNYPSKLMMYYYYQRPIFALTTKNSNLETELLSTGHSICYYGDSKAVSKYLYTAITEYESLLGFDHQAWKKHTVDNVMSLYQQLLSDFIPNLKY